MKHTQDLEQHYRKDSFQAKHISRDIACVYGSSGFSSH